MDVPEANMSPQDRLCEIARIFAAGILRLKTCSEIGPESAQSGQKSEPRKLSESGRNYLDTPARQGPDLPAG